MDVAQHEGPWAWGLDDVDAIWAAHAPDGGNVVCLPPPESAKASFARWPDRARLIAAAPDLLKYLELALGVITASKIVWMGEDNARAAIAKARAQPSEGITP